MDELLKTTPVTPPTVKRKRNPATHKTRGENTTGEPYIVASHEKILTPVGTAMIIVAAVK